MYHHVKKLMYTVRVDAPDPTFGNMLLEQFGGANGELAAAMQYSIQGLNCEDPERKDLLMDIGTEELSHLEIVGALARLHLKPMKFDREAAEADPLIAIAGGGGVNLFNSMGNAWTADYLKITGELDVDLRSNIAAEARAKIVYERLINFTDDAGHEGRAAVPDDARDHAHEGVHRGARKHGQAALLDRPDSADAGARRSVLQRLDRRRRRRRNRCARPVERGRRLAVRRGARVPGTARAAPNAAAATSTIGATSTPTNPELIEELLVEQLRDLLHAEGQLVKALPKMVEGAPTLSRCKRRSRRTWKRPKGRSSA